MGETGDRFFRQLPSRQPLILKEGILKEVLWEKLKDIVAAKGKGALFTGLFLESLARLLPRGEESVEGEGEGRRREEIAIKFSITQRSRGVRGL